MGKKGLTKSIETLINRIGEQPPPSLADIKSELVKCLSLAEALEDGQVIREAEAKVATAKAALEQSNAQNAKIEPELQAARAETEAFREERKKQEEAEQQQDISDIQFQILQRLPLVHEYGHRLDSIARAAGIPVDETEIHLHALCGAKLARKTDNWPRVNESVWQRTTRGNKYIVARRLAGEKEQQKPRPKPRNLSKSEEMALLTMAGGEGVSVAEIAERIGQSVVTTTMLLVLLREKNMATDGGFHGKPWTLLEAGLEYLVERRLI